VLFFLLGLIIFAASIPHFVTAYFMSEDVIYLFSMPFTACDITTAKLNLRYRDMLAVSAMLLLPFGIGLGTQLQVTAVFFWLGLILACLLIPLASTMLAAIVAVVVMKLFRIARNRESLAFLGGVLVLILLVVFTAVPSSSLHGIDLKWLMTKGVRVVSAVGYIFPAGQLSANLMNGNGVGCADALLLLFAMVCIMACYTMVYVAVVHCFYRDVVLKMQDMSSVGKKVSTLGILKASVSRSVMNTLIRKDFKLLLRNHAFVLNCVILPLALPIIVVGAMLFAGGSSEPDAATDSETAMLVHFIFILVITAFMGFINSTAHHSLSREGRSFLFMKQMPVPYEVQLGAKRRLARLLTFFSCAPYLFVYEIIRLVHGDSSPVCCAAVVVTNISLLMLFTDIQLFDDLRAPRLVWENEADVAKGMFGLVHIAIYSAATIAAAIGLCMLFDKLSLGVENALIAFAAICFVLAFAIGKLLMRYGVRRMEEL
jgi:ABC-2 type transport system permease protein